MRVTEEDDARAELERLRAALFRPDAVDDGRYSADGAATLTRADVERLALAQGKRERRAARRRELLEQLAARLDVYLDDKGWVRYRYRTSDVRASGALDG